MECIRYLKECWAELWSPDSHEWQYIDRILFVLLPIITLVLGVGGRGGVMASLAWIIPLSIWFLFLLLVVPYRLTTRYRRQRDELSVRLDIKRRRKSLADKLAKFYVEGSKAKKALANNAFNGDAIKLHGAWSSPLIAYFRANPDELGEARLLSLIPDNRDLIISGAAGSGSGVREPDYVYCLWTLQLEHLRKLIEEFLR